MPHEQIEDSYIDPMADFVTIKVNKNEHERLKGATPCTFPDCMRARAVRAAGEEYQRGVAEGLEKAAETALTFATAAMSPYQGKPVIPADIRAVVNVICRIAESIRSVAK